MAVSRGKMLGHFAWGPGGYQCRCCAPDSIRPRKAAERREVAAEIAGELAGGDEPYDPEREALLGECHHGCSGSPSCGSGQCTFLCHQGVNH